MKKIFFILFSPFILFGQTTDWVKSFGGIESDKGISIGTDSLGFIYISGYYNSAVDFDQISLVNNPNSGTNKENFVATFLDKLEFIFSIAFSEISFCLSFK